MSTTTATMTSGQACIEQQTTEAGFWTEAQTIAVQEQLDSFRYHAYSIWLFTYSDMKTIIAPSTYFAIVSALAAPVLGLPSVSTPSMLYRLPLVVFWVWANLLPFNIGNQASEDAVAEDKINKPWRPLPAGRMSIKTAKTWSKTLTPLASLFSAWCLRGPGFVQALVLVKLGHLHNDLGGGDSSWVGKNALNGMGFLCYFSGALDVIIGRAAGRRYSGKEVQWFVMLFLIVFTTVASQDFADMAGDSQRGRKTMPLQIGEIKARIITAVFVIVWSMACCWFWSSSAIVSVVFGTLGALVAVRTIKMRCIAGDKKTFKLWNLWLAFACALPLLGSYV